MEERIGEERMELYVTCLHSGSWILAVVLHTFEGSGRRNKEALPIWPRTRNRGGLCTSTTSPLASKAQPRVHKTGWPSRTSRMSRLDLWQSATSKPGFRV